MEGYNDEELFQMAWMANHPITNKDKELEAIRVFEKQPKKAIQKKTQRNPSAWNLPQPEQELDLHGYTVDEALAAIEEMFLAMNLAKMTVLRIVHGGGHPSSGLIKKALDKKVRSEWRGKVKFYGIEPGNAGSSILQIEKNFQEPKSKNKF